MKGKIRVYARARPLSRSELDRVSIINYIYKFLRIKQDFRVYKARFFVCIHWLASIPICWQGNHSIISSPDEYSLIIQTMRGAKDFQYDAVFTPEDNQEKVFEDSNVSTVWIELQSPTETALSYQLVTQPCPNLTASFYFFYYFTEFDSISSWRIQCLYFRLRANRIRYV